MIIEIPGYKTLDLDYLVLDYNGTIAVDGLIPPAIKERLLLLGDSFKILCTDCRHSRHCGCHVRRTFFGNYDISFRFRHG